MASGEARVIHVVDNLDDPGALAWHSVIAGLVVSKVQAQDVNGTNCSAGHELFESLVDPNCDGWVKRPDGMLVAKEICDPVEADAYPINVTILGETRTLLGSNWATPAWFGAGSAPFDKMAKLTAPFTMSSGGYTVVADAAGNETDVFARARVEHGGVAGRLSAARKLENPGSRLLQRLRK